MFDWMCYRSRSCYGFVVQSHATNVQHTHDTRKYFKILSTGINLNKRFLLPVYRNKLVPSIWLLTAKSKGGKLVSRGPFENDCGNMCYPNVKYYVTKTPSLITDYDESTVDEQSSLTLLRSPKKVLLDQRGVVYSQKGAYGKQHTAALNTLDTCFPLVTQSNFGMLSVDNKLQSVTIGSPGAPVASICTTKKGVVLGVLQGMEDDEHIPVLLMAESENAHAHYGSTSCFIVAISLIDIKRLKAGLVDDLVEIFVSHFHIQKRNLQVVVGTTPSLQFPTLNGREVLELFSNNCWKSSRHFQFVHMIGKRHTEQLVVYKRRKNRREEQQVIARKTIGSVSWKVDITRIVAERFRNLGILVVHIAVPMSLLDLPIKEQNTNQIEEASLVDTHQKNILSAAISITKTTTN